MNVTIVSDCTDVAYAEMTQAILSSFIAARGDPGAPPFIGPLAPCEPYSLTNASFLGRLLAETAPSGTIIMIIVNFISQRPERIIGTLRQKPLIFEGPNTGAFGWLIEDFGVDECFELRDPGFVPFGGKRVHAPAVGRALAGEPLSSLGDPFPVERIRRHLPRLGEVLHIDNFGNAKLYLRAQDLEFEDGARVSVEFDGAPMGPIEAVVGTRMMEHRTGAWVLYPGSSMGLYELGQVRARGFLGLPVVTGMSARLTGLAHGRGRRRSLGVRGGR